MAETTKIAWADATWNPWVGCHKVSPGCTNCYAEAWAKRVGRSFDPVTITKQFFVPERWRGNKRVFVCSLSDFFIKQADDLRVEAWRIMMSTPQHTYMLLTKRPGRIMWAWEQIPQFAQRNGWPDHIWAGVTVENARYLPRLDVLAQVPAKVRFVSCEPCLSAIDMGLSTRAINFVIVGGESGPHARPMQIEWLESIVEQCEAAGVPVFVKQDSGRYPGKQGRIPDRLWNLRTLGMEQSRTGSTAGVLETLQSEMEVGE